MNRRIKGVYPQLIDDWHISLIFPSVLISQLLLDWIDGDGKLEIGIGIGIY